MSTPKQTILRFLLKTDKHFTEIMGRFHPQGKIVLNSTEWRGKEPRSCGIKQVQSGPLSSKTANSFEILVSYRPKGCITFAGSTKYDGWTAMLLDRAKDGTLLDGHGKPLPEGQPPVYLPYEVYGDSDFNKIDFGEFVGEFDVDAVKHVQWTDVMRQIEQSSKVSAGITSTFMAPRRDRPLVKIILSDAPSGTGRDGWGTKILNVNNSTPHLQQVIVDHLTEIVSGFIEGRYSMSSISNNDVTLVELSHSFVDCTANKNGGESRFDCLHEYVSPVLIEELAKHIMALYNIEASVVDGEKVAILLQNLTADKWQD